MLSSGLMLAVPVVELVLVVVVPVNALWFPVDGADVVDAPMSFKSDM
jgi:hypothetical protein